MSLSAKEAAEAVGISKHGIIKAINRGRISAAKGKNGEWEIDPAELFRVYEPKRPVTTDHVHPVSKQVNDSTQTRIAVLETKLAAAEAHNNDLRSRLEKIEIKSEEREKSLRAEKDKLIALVERQSLMIEHRQETEKTKQKGWFHWFYR